MKEIQDKGTKINDIEKVTLEIVEKICENEYTF